MITVTMRMTKMGVIAPALKVARLVLPRSLTIQDCTHVFLGNFLGNRVGFFLQSYVKVLFCVVCFVLFVSLFVFLSARSRKRVVVMLLLL